MERKFVCLFNFLLLVACSESRSLPTPNSQLIPTSPNPVTVKAAPCPPCPVPGVHALSGMVKASGVPVAGANVGLVKLGEQTPVSAGPEELIASTVTNGDGYYSFAKVENVSFSGALVSVSRADYFTDTKYIQMSEDRQLDFDLERAVDTISVGQVLLGQVGEARCASFGYGGGGGAFCRRFALPVKTAGTLEVAIASNPPMPFDISVIRPDGTIGVNGSSSISPLTVGLTVRPGTYQVDVVHIYPTSREFELSTVLR